MRASVIIILFLEALSAFYLIYREGLLKDKRYLIWASVLIFAGFFIRFAVLDYETLDYQNFLKVWVDYFRQNGGFKALSRPIGNYNIPYLYFLALFSYSDINDLYLIKLLSIFFDVILSFAAMKLTGIYTDSKPKRFIVFFAIFFLPTVYLNGSLWGQCDSIYVAFALLGIYLALKDRPVLSMICAAISFGFKLQAVFFLPVYIILLIRGKIKLRHILLFPISYIILVLPAVFMGMDFMNAVTLYFGQTGSIGAGLNYNSPSVYALFQYSLPEKYNAIASNLGIGAAFALIGVISVVVFHNRNNLNNKAVLSAALIFAVGIPFLLPHMHERYFFLADILSLILAFSAKDYWDVPILTQFASLLGYHAYLKMRYLLLMNAGAICLLFVLVRCANLLYYSLKPEKRNI